MSLYTINMIDTVRRMVAARPGITAAQIAVQTGEIDSTYGSYKRVSWAVAQLRKRGELVDCPRCVCCGSATSRNQRNVGLYLNRPTSEAPTS